MPSTKYPSSGLFLFMSEANPIIKRFLRTESKSVAQIFERPFSDILKDFDENALKLLSGRPWAHGFAGGALKEAFPELAGKNDGAKS